MKLITRAEFHKVKPGTIFQKCEPNCFEEMQVFEESLETDFVASPLGYPDFEAVTNMDSVDAGFAKLEGGESVALAYGEICGRDGLFDMEQKFAVYERQDVERLIAYLQQQLARAY